MIDASSLRLGSGVELRKMLCDYERAIKRLNDDPQGQQEALGLLSEARQMILAEVVRRFREDGEVRR